MQLCNNHKFKLAINVLCVLLPTFTLQIKQFGFNNQIECRNQGDKDNERSSQHVMTFSFRWTSGVCCCGSLTSVLMTLLVQTINHLAMLTASSIMLNTTESFLDTIISAVDTNDRWGLNEIRLKYVFVSKLSIFGIYPYNRCCFYLSFVEGCYKEVSSITTLEIIFYK